MNNKQVWMETARVNGNYTHHVLDDLEGKPIVRFTGTKSACLQFILGMMDITSAPVRA